ncbi:MAG TPA: hypothetical protein VL484_16545 [Vicinamibacterales bacterium]|jgi:hypothetical protein|nr:hypothetical protein [Vicinamibacterales bacterium]
MGAIVFAAGLAAAGAGCSHGPSASQDRANTPPETATATSSNVPMTATVTGCLAAGDAADTFVLNAARSEGDTTSATYNLVGASADELRSHIGEQVKVSGTVTSGEQVAERSMPQAQTDKTKGTTGTPTVQTQTDVQIKRLQVSSVSPEGHKCEVDRGR